MRKISTRNLFLVEFLIFLSFYLVEIKYLGQAPSAILKSLFFGLGVSFLHLNFRIFIPADIPLFAGIFYLFFWQGFYFFLCTSCFGKWANMYELGYILFFCLGVAILTDYYRFFKWQNVQEQNVFILAIVTITSLMITGYFLPPALALTRYLLIILAIFYYFVLLIL